MSENRIFKYQIDHARERLGQALNAKLASIEDEQQAEFPKKERTHYEEIGLQMIEDFARGTRTFTAMGKRSLRAAVISRRALINEPNRGYIGNPSFNLREILGCDEAEAAAQSKDKETHARLTKKFETRKDRVKHAHGVIEDQLVLGSAPEALALIDKFVDKVF